MLRKDHPRAARAAASCNDSPDLFLATCPYRTRSASNQADGLSPPYRLRRQRFHDLRHCCATLLLAQGVSLRVIMETLGHNQIGVTMNTCAHVIPALREDATARMEAFLRSAP